MKKLMYSRNFNVEYFEKDTNLWSVVSHLKDSIHEIKVEIDVEIPSMVVKDANLDFIDYPIENCLLVKDKIKDLIGLCLYGDFLGKAKNLFLGCRGCPNIMNLISVSLPALIYFYNVEEIKKGNLTDDEWWQFVTKNLSNECIAHKTLAEAALNNEQNDI